MMKPRLIAFLIIIFCLPSLPARSEPAVVSGPELLEMLSGNTIVGTWNGDPYRQYFNKNGSTIYAPQSATPTHGSWRINQEKNLYESWWRGSGWSSYQIVREEDKLFWVSKSNDPQPFKVLPGDQLVQK